MKKPWLAALLNVVPGVGYVYLGVRKPFAWILIVSTVATILEQFEPEVMNYTEVYPVTPWGILAAALIFAAFIVDGFYEAKRINKK